MNNQQNSPGNIADGQATSSGGKQSTWLYIAITLVSICAVAGCVFIDWQRNQAITALLPDSAQLTQFKITYVLLDLMAPLVVGGIVSVVASRNRGRRFLFTFCGVAVVLVILRLNHLAQPLRSARVLQPVVHIAGGKRLHNQTPLFDLEIPQEFESYSNPKDPASVKYTFIAPSESNGSKKVIGVTILDGLVPPDNEANRRRLRESVPEKVELTTKNWRGLSVPTFISREEVRGVEVIIYRVRVPLTPKAVELAVFGPASNEASLSVTVDALLGSLDGSTNWRIPR